MTTHSVLLRAQKHKQFFTALIISCLTVLLAAPATFPTATADPSDSNLITDLSFHWIEPINGDRIDNNHLILRDDGDTTTPARLEFRLLRPSEGVTSYAIGTVKVEVPFGVWSKRLGDITGGVKITGIDLEGSVPVGSTDWVYRIDQSTKTLIITNNAQLPVPGHAALQFGFTVADNGGYAKLIEYKDGTPTQPPLTATVTLSDPSVGSTPVSFVSNSLTAEINTTAKAWLTGGSQTCQKQDNNDLICPLHVGTGDYGNNQPYMWDNLEIFMPGDSVNDVLVRYPHAYIDHIESANPDAQFDIADDKHSATVLYPGDRADTHDVTIWVRVPAEDYPYNANDVNVGFNIRASSQVYPSDGLDPSYQKSVDLSASYHDKKTEDKDVRLEMPFFLGAKNSYAPFVIDGTGKEKWLADDLDGTKPEECNHLSLYSEPQLSELRTMCDSWNKSEKAKDLEWRTYLATQLLTTGVLTRGSFPTLESFKNTGDTWTATVTNTSTITSRLANIEIPLPEGVEVDTDSLVFKLTDGTQEETVETEYTYENGTLIVQMPNIPAGKKFTASFSLAGSSSVDSLAGALDVTYSGHQINPANEHPSNKVSRTDTFTVTNYGTETTPAGIPLELNRLSCAANNTNLSGCFTTKDDLDKGKTTNDIYKSFVGGSEVNVPWENSVWGYSHTVYLPELQPGQTFTHEVISTGYTSDTEENELTTTAFRTKLGHSTQNSAVLPEPSASLYAFISDLKNDNKKNYGWRSLTVETIDTHLTLYSPETRELVAGDDFDITSVAFQHETNSTGTKETFGITDDPFNAYTGTNMWNGYLDVWGRASESEPWTKYARVHFADHGQINHSSTPLYDHVEFFGVEGVEEIEKADNEVVRISVPEGTAQTRVTYSSTTGVANIRYKYFNIVRFNHDGTNLRDVMDKYPTEDIKVRNYRSARYWYTDETTDITSSTPSDHIIGVDTVSSNLTTTITLERTPTFKTSEIYQFTYSQWGLQGTYKKDKRYFEVNNIISTNSSLSGFGSSCVYADKIQSGEWAHMTHARFYSLQPMGVRVDEDSVKLSQYLDGKTTWKDSPGEIVDVQVIENWRGSGRQMLIVEVDNLAEYTPTPDCNRDTTSSNESAINSANIQFTSYYSAVDFFVYKSGLTRYDAVENLSDNQLGYNSTKEGQEGADGVANPSSATFADGYMHNLSPGSYSPNWQTGSQNTDKKFLYTSRNQSVSGVPQIYSGFRKFVAPYGVPFFDVEAWVAPEENYIYRLVYQNDSPLDRKELVLFDSIETFQPPITPDTPEHAHFRGHFRGLNLDSLHFQGIEPVVYYSIIPELDINAHQDLDEEINGERVWIQVEDVTTFDGIDMDTVKAFAVDCSKKKSGNDFYLQQDDYMLVEVYMQAPDREEVRAEGNLTPDKPVAYVYNNGWMDAVEVNTDGSVAGTDFHDSFPTKLKLHDPTVVLKANKALTGWKLAEGQFTFGLYNADGSPVLDKNGNPITATNDADGNITFPPITFTSEDANKAFAYTIREITDNSACTAPGYTCNTDDAEYAVTVNVYSAGESVTAIATYEGGIDATMWSEDLPTFNNQYTSTGTADIEARKEVTAEEGVTMPPVRGGEFEFTLYNEAGDAVATATNNADGTINFDTLTFTQDDINIETSKATYTYTIKETKWEAFWHPVDPDHTETVTITLEDDGAGTITTTVSYDTDGAVFTNTYSEPPATRAATGQAPPAWLLPLLFALAGGALAHHLYPRLRRKN